MAGKKGNDIDRTRSCLRLYKLLGSLYPWEKKVLHEIRNGRRYTFKCIHWLVYGTHQLFSVLVPAPGKYLSCGVIAVTVSWLFPFWAPASLGVGWVHDCQWTWVELIFPFPFRCGPPCYLSPPLSAGREGLGLQVVTVVPERSLGPVSPFQIFPPARLISVCIDFGWEQKILWFCHAAEILGSLFVAFSLLLTEFKQEKILQKLQRVT